MGHIVLQTLKSAILAQQQPDTKLNDLFGEKKAVGQICRLPACDTETSRIVKG